MKIGARTIKTGLVVTLTVLLVNILETRIGAGNYNIAGIAAVTAIISMQPTIKGSLLTFRNRVIATLIGAIAAFILAFTLGLNAFYLGLGSIAIILICLKLKLNESIRFALITLVALGTINSFSFDIMQIVYRVSGILMGLIVSTVLNVVFMPPDYTEDLKTKINELRIKFEHLYSSVINDILREKNVGKDIIKDQRQIIRDELDDARDIFSLLMDDVFLTGDNRSKKKLFFKKYRRSINAIQSNLERLTAIHRSIIFMPGGPQYSEIHQDLYRYLEYLLIMHQHIYNSIALNEDYQEVEKNTDPEGIREKIMELIKADNRECIFEFYNVYSEATRINEKLEQLISEFELAS